LTVAELLLSELTPLIGAQHGTFYIADTVDDVTKLKLLAGYAIDEREGIPKEFNIGQGLVGQCAKERARILVKNVPGEYVRINSSLGNATPLSIVVLPVLFEGDVKASIELASFGQFSDVHLAFLDQLTQSIGIVLNTIAATMRTEQLLQQSQALAEELQSQQLQLQQTNEELQEKAQLWPSRRPKWKPRIRKWSRPRRRSKKSRAALPYFQVQERVPCEHEPRAADAANNLLILARMLSENSDKNLTPKQVKFAETIHTSGTDLLALISDILDLSKIESGKMDVEIGGVRFVELQDYCSKTFPHVADGKGLDSRSISERRCRRKSCAPTPSVCSRCEESAFERAQVHGTRVGAASIDKATSGWTPGHTILGRAKAVIAFSVADTGIGIQSDKQRIISKRSSKPTEPPAASTAGPDWAFHQP